MDDEGHRRLPLIHENRIRARDLKLYRRDEERAAWEGRNTYRCPCNLCGGRRRPCSRRTIARHFQTSGRHGTLRGWTNGDDYDSSDEEWETNIQENARAFLGLEEPIQEIPLDGGLGFNRMVRQALERADQIHCAAMEYPENAPMRNEQGITNSNIRGASESASAMESSSNSEETASEDSTEDYYEDAEENLEPGFGDPSSSETSGSSDFDHGQDDMEELLGRIANGERGVNSTIDIAASLPLFEGASLSVLSATLLILNCCRTHNVSNAFVNELLMLLCMSILPIGNVLPKSEYEASKMLKNFGLSYDLIHACPRGCVLFRGELEAEDICPCGSGRYRQCGRSTVPSLVLRHFPLIPRLQRLFSSKKLSKLNVWHQANRSTDGKMRHTADSAQWKFVDIELEPETVQNRFGSDARHLHLGLATDGLNPWSEKRSTDSMWPVMFLNYNLPPWLVTKKYFVMLCLLIPTKVTVTGDNFDVFLQPAIDELQELWTPEGVPTKDAQMEAGDQHFGLRAVLMWTIHDFPAYGLVAGLATKGFRACPLCGPNTMSRYSKVLRKMVYCNCHRRFLQRNHYFRGDFAAFDYGAEVEEEMEAMSGNDIIRRGRESERFILEGGNDRHQDFPGKLHGVKRVSGLYQLAYWRKIPRRNLLDVMHIEKNICDSLLKFLMGITDTAACRRDMEEEQIKPHLWVRRDGQDENQFVKPAAPYVLTKDEQKKLLDQIAGISVPTGYCGDMKKHILKNKLGNMKSHDFHVLLQFILPVCLRHLMDPGPRMAIIRLGRLFTMLCKKVVDIAELDRLEVYATETMCLLEIWFPPAAFDIMWHLPVHLVKQLRQCGPVANIWCYPIERHMGFLKKYIRKRSRPEACIANAYMYEEALGFCTEYFKLHTYTKRRVWDDDEEPGDCGEVLMGSTEEKVLSEEERRAIHSWIIRNSTATAEAWRLYNEEHEALERERRLYRTEAAQRGLPRRQQCDYPENIREDMADFVEWLSMYTASLIRGHGLRNVDIELLRLSKMPSLQAESYKHMWAYRNHYRVHEEGGELGYVTQDYGIACVFGAEEGRSAGVSMVGVLKDIIVVRYSARRRVVMQGSWIRNNGGNRSSTKVDEYGFTTVRFNDRIAVGQEPYVLPATVHQVFFVDDWQHRGWKVVLQKEPRSRRVVDVEDEQILGISGNYGGLNLPENLNAPKFRPRARNGGEAIPEAEIARLNALVNGERFNADHGRGRARRGRGRRRR